MLFTSYGSFLGYVIMSSGTWASEGFFPGGAKSGKILIFPLEIKKKNFIAEIFKIQGPKAPVPKPMGGHQSKGTPSGCVSALSNDYFNIRFVRDLLKLSQDWAALFRRMPRRGCRMRKQKTACVVAKLNFQPFRDVITVVNVDM